MELGAARLGWGTGRRTVSARLGHADPSTTQRIYTYVPDGADRAAAQAIEAALLGS